MVLWKWKQKEWFRNRIEKGACGQGSGIMEGNREDNMLEDGVMLNVISAYAPQVGCIREEKETFWLDLDETVEKIQGMKELLWEQT